MLHRLIGHCTFLVCLASAQTAPQQPAAEVASQDVPITFQSHVNLVLVPVIVKDKAGKTVGALTKEDFQLFDRGKAQSINKFSVEKAGAKTVAIVPPIEIPLEKSPDETPRPGIVAPDRFVAWLFDDIHLSFSDLALARQASEKYLRAHVTQSSRMAVYSTSGQTSVDFTDDRDKLSAGLTDLKPRPVARSMAQECPDISYYMADLIVNKNDPIALHAAAQETLVCMQLPNLQSAMPMVQPAANRALSAGEHETRIALLTMKNLVDRMSRMPGERVIVMISPGFHRLDDQLQEETGLIDKAIKANVTINTLDARGLYTDLPDITKQTYSAQASLTKQQYDRDAARDAADIMAEIAAGTGGTFFEHNNDIAAGVQTLSETPEVHYVLGFSPQNLKLDGAYHQLKITLKKSAGLAVRARRGYYAPRRLSSADDVAREEISQALFSRDEVRDIPLDIHTQFFKSSATEARLVVVTRIDVRKLHYRKNNGRNNDEVILVSGLFDRNGNFLQSVSKTLQMRLKDETLAGQLNGGIPLRADFKVPPGSYIVRLVARDAEGQTMGALNGAVEIP